MIFVCPVFDKMPASMLSLSLLYPFPRVPEPPPNDGIVIMDSGAYALSKAGRKMDAAHIEKLQAHYTQHAGVNLLPIAPDEFLSPEVSMRNFAAWRQQYQTPVVPVFQFPRRKIIDLYALQQQIRFYADHYSDERQVLAHGRVALALSNPSLHALEAHQLGMGRAVSMIRAAFPDAWIHNLGAGWDAEDVKAYRKMGWFDSIDSIAYYNDKSRRSWDGRLHETWQAASAWNGQTANQKGALGSAPAESYREA